jgi:hypothetical protein
MVTPNAALQRRARTGASDKPCMRDLLIARPLHAIVGRNAGGIQHYLFSGDRTIFQETVTSSPDFNDPTRNMT